MPTLLILDQPWLLITGRDDGRAEINVDLTDFLQLLLRRAVGRLDGALLGFLADLLELFDAFGQIVG